MLLGSTFAPLVKLTDLNPLMLLTGLGIFGYLLTLKLDENDGMRDYLEKENVSLPVIKKPEADVSIQLTAMKAAWERERTLKKKVDFSQIKNNVIKIKKKEGSKRASNLIFQKVTYFSVKSYGCSFSFIVWLLVLHS